MEQDVYERFDASEIDEVRAYRRRVWVERAQNDPDGARAQALDAIRTHHDSWADGLSVRSLVSVALRGVRVADLDSTRRYALASLLEAGE